MKDKPEINLQSDSLINLFESISHPVTIIKDKKIVYINSIANNLLSSGKNNVIGRSFMEFIHPEYEQALLERISMLNKGIDYLEPIEIKIIIDNTETIIMKIQTIKINFENESSILITGTNISRNLKIIETLQKRTHQLNQRVKELDFLYNISKLINEPSISIRDKFQGIVELIPSAFQYPEITTARIIIGGKEYQTYNFKMTSWKIEECIDFEGETLGIIEVYYLKKKPHAFIGPFLQEEKRIIEIIVKQIVILFEQIHLNKKVLTEHELLKNIINTIKEIILFVDTEGRIVYFNPYMESFSGYKLEEVQGKDWFSLFLSHKNYSALREGYKKKVGRLHTEGKIASIVVKSGEKKEVEWDYRTMKNTHGIVIGVLTIGHNITEQKKIREQINQIEKMEVIRKLSSGLVHDFNNQLAGILDNAEILKDRLKDNIALVSYVDNILESVKDTATLTSQILTFSRDKKYVSFPVDLNEVLLGVISLVKNSFDKRIEIIHQLNTSNTTIIGDSNQLQNLFMILVLNAKESISDKGKISLSSQNIELDETTCKTKFYQHKITPGKYIRISISDTGSGMSKETMKHMFEPFFTTKDKGTGLGLSSVYGIIKVHNGAIDVVSEIGQGSTFNVLFPCEIKKESHFKITTQKPIGTKKTMHIMFIDDDALIRDMTYIMLNKLGHEVTICNNGQQAIEIYEKNWKDFDAVIIDMIMPEMNGIEVYRAMLEINKDIVALLTTGYSLEDEVKDIFKEGVKGFIKKPYCIAELIEEIEKALNK